MALYLTDAPTAQLAYELSATDKGSVVVLFQDGVTLATRAPKSITCYALAPDVKRRGLGKIYSDAVRQITYAELVDLIVEHPVVNLH